jgi:L-asparagine permease
MSKRGVPYGGICLTALIGLFGVLLNGVVPEKAFEIVLNMAALGIIASWGTIVVCQIQLYRWSKQGIMNRPSFRMWGSPYTGYLTMVFLVAVLVLMALDPPIGTWTVATLVIIIPALIVGWYAVRERVLAIAQEREGFTGQFPVVANRPPPRQKDDER